MLAVTALAASLLFTFAGRGARDSVRIAERGLRAGDLAQLEAVFRQAVRAVVLTDQADFEGSSLWFAMAPMALPVFCPYAGMGLPATIAVERDGSGGRLVCRARDRALVIGRWPAGTAVLDYSSDGAGWSDRWPPATPTRNALNPPLVRLTLREPSGARTAIIERAGDDAMLIERAAPTATPVQTVVE